MSWVDAHCHPDWLPDPEAALAQAGAAGIGHWLLPGTEPGQWQEASRRFGEDRRIRLAFGHHPWFIAEQSPDIRPLRDALMQTPQPVALGEIGLDFYRGSSPRPAAEHQEAWFEAQLALAAELDLPVIVHAVKAHDRVLRQLKRYPTVTGVIHAFLGPYDQAMAYVDKGWYLGCGSLILKSPKTRDAFTRLPAERILLETDAPDMRPPQPAADNPLLDLLQTARCLAQARQLSLETLQQQTRANAQALFQFF